MKTYEVEVNLLIEADDEQSAIDNFRNYVQRVEASVFEVRRWSTKDREVDALHTTFKGKVVAR